MLSTFKKFELSNNSGLYFQPPTTTKSSRKIKTETIKFLINTNIVIQDKKEEKQTGNFVKRRKISRNEPCSCGSGKKYKHCHGKVA